MQWRFLIAISSLGLALSACEKDQETYTVPTTYNFSNVDYSGQSTRLDMLDELKTYMANANLQGTTLQAATLHNLFNNQNAAFTSSTLNNSGKQLRDKTANNTLFDTALDSLALASQSNTQIASQGQAGLLSNPDSTQFYLLNSKGFELAQFIEKGIASACFYYQASSIYLEDGEMNVDNTLVTDGQGTEMEHHWDEAFGYLGVPLDFPLNLSNLRYWGAELNARESTLGLSATLMNAFIAGRAAISNKDLNERDVQISKVHSLWEKLIAASAISKLNVAKQAFAHDAALKYHALSQAYTYIWALQYGGHAQLSTAQINNILVALANSANPLEANLYSVTETKINTAITTLSSYFSLDAVKDNL